MKLYRKLIQKTLREGSSTFTGDRSKLSWRKNILREFGEWVPVANAGGPTMGTSTTFGYYVGGSPVINGETGQPITYTASGLGGVEALPTTVTIDQGFGDIANVDAPTYNQLSLAGYAPMLPFFRRDDYKDVNAMLDASQEYARRVLADVYMGARVELNREIDRQEEQRIEIMNKVSSYVSQLGIDFEELQKGAQIDKYGRLVVLNYDGGVLGGLKNSNNRSITIYNPAKDAQGNLLKIQDTGNKTLQKGETVFGTQYSPMPDEATVQTWSNVGDVAHFTDFGSGHNPNQIGEVLVGNKIVGPKIVGSKAVGKGYSDVLDQLANTFKVGTSKNFFDYYINFWSKNPTNKRVDATNLVQSKDMKVLTNIVNSVAVQSSLKNSDYQTAIRFIQNEILDTPGLRNSLGNGIQIDKKHYQKTGEVKLTKDYVFIGNRDIEGGADNQLIRFGAAGYALAKGGVAQNKRMKYSVIVKESTTWERIQKYR